MLFIFNMKQVDHLSGSHPNSSGLECAVSEGHCLNGTIEYVRVWFKRTIKSVFQSQKFQVNVFLHSRNARIKSFFSLITTKE
jgi:hypothetical protein